MTARYNGVADWYAARTTDWAEHNRTEVVDLLGPGDGRLTLDLGCGNGNYFDIVRGTGRRVIGLDRSADQLRIARDRRLGRTDPVPLVEGDSARLPFADASFDDVLTLWISTDLDDILGTLREIARLLKPGGAFYFYGVHPCFNGPHSEYLEDGSRVVHPTYSIADWHQPQPWWADDGIRVTVGMRHTPLAVLLNGFVDAGLTLEHFAEPSTMPVPHTLAIRARR
ncbi:pimeloyl-CoA biosynthesis protein BioC [Kribbella amoyensis]|uniref:Pimeloyl-CoA biosynthesis protein BioC n=1 Tax=Kribbella amoyensis TaxID=996641 RepID=A0A561BLP1_9ACTN|nr:class I SAM-dependent methyltransferase [Kribbella amoyensis]TWD79779.1 pimeloyl-CoA biosynthesis protein BioC [Kribbella amoyensis]